jgi:subfamily B ATP-binding cassette protein MsbA
VTLASLRAQIGIVTQETVLFDDTIAANIAFGRPARRRRHRGGGARRARARVHRRLDDGYDTMIGERGQRCRAASGSGWRLPRRSARFPILILDEATSSLDAESEMLVQEALSTLMLNRTSFVIAPGSPRCGAPTPSWCSEHGRISRPVPTTIARVRRGVCETVRIAAAGRPAGPATT